LLRIEGFGGIDPQAPLGGPDGGKDILCEKDGDAFVAAVYFPRGNASYSASKRKFNALKTSLSHNRSGFIFLTNQTLTIGERSELERLAAAAGKRCLIYHRERLRIMLDSPQGYGARLRHLGVPMSNEEQAAYFAASGQSVTEALREHTRAIERLSHRVLRMGRESMNFAIHTSAVVLDAVRDKSLGRTDVVAMLEATADMNFQRAVGDSMNAVSAQLSPALLCCVHRLIMTSDPVFAGRFRQTQVWLVDNSGTPNAATECPAWDKVPALAPNLSRTGIANIRRS
jgi:hypothetical protein